MSDTQPAVDTESGIIDDVLHSNTLYRKMIGLLDTMREPSPTGESADRLQGGIATFIQLQQEIEKHELLVNESLHNTTIRSDFLKAALVKRQELIADVLTRNKEVTAQAMAIQSLLGNEIKSMNRGQAALSGYKQQHPATGKFSRSL